METIIIKAIREIRAMGFINPFNEREIVIEDKVALDLGYFDGALWLHGIRSFEPGGGRLGMKVVLDIADKYQITVRLDVEPTGKKTMKRHQLIQWYKRLGFRKVKLDVDYERLPIPMSLDLVNKWIDKEFPDVRIGEGTGFYYIYSDETDTSEVISQLPITWVHVRHIYDLTIPQWIETVMYLLAQ